VQLHDDILAALRMIVSIVVGYLLGTIPSADIATRLAKGADLRSSGSGNPGAANAIKVLGARWGYAVLVADIVKGGLAAVIGGNVGAVAAVVGHCFPVWNRFRGGKGVACSVGQCAVTFPAWFPFDLALAALTSASPRWKQRAFASTAVASAGWVLAAVVWWQADLPNLWGPEPSNALPAAAAASSAVILYKFATARRPAA
jgi:glycerol-3-phosphate acyltransferase PlsY